MKKLQQFCAAVVLTIAFTFSALAGDMSTPGVVQPPPPPPSNQTTTTNEMSCPDATSTGVIQTSDASTSDPVTDATLSLLQGVLSVF